MFCSLSFIKPDSVMGEVLKIYLVLELEFRLIFSIYSKEVVKEFDALSYSFEAIEVFISCTVKLLKLSQT